METLQYMRKEYWCFDVFGELLLPPVSIVLCINMNLMLLLLTQYGRGQLTVVCVLNLCRD